ncbi:DUF998 domain-containing protein [Candidatus Bathyarchaeota archaeon]|nr:DUF998 domain-containing protein [Candidatus Bathyarchaeota archaeon]
MRHEDRTWLTISGICGIITPIVAFTCIILAVSYYPPFSWTDNALSDLGIKDWPTATLFNAGLIISGILALVFVSGLHIFLKEKALGKSGVFLFLLAALALIAIGFFPEDLGPMHFYASVAFFLLFPISMLINATALSLSGKTKTGLFTLLAALVAASAWIIQWTVEFGPNVAIPETISAISASAWMVALSCIMIREASHSSKRQNPPDSL